MASKRMQAANSAVNKGQVYPLLDGLSSVISASEKGKTKFRQSITMAVHLGINAKKEAIRGSSVLPHGTGKKIKIAVVVADGQQAEAALKAGAVRAGMDDLLKDMEQGNLDYDVIIATPESMAKVSRLGRVLGPKGLMPNPKDGTVSADVETAVKQAFSGRVMYRNEKAGIVHVLIGHVEMKGAELVDNIQIVVNELVRLKPSASKGKYLKKLYIASTMGPAVQIDLGDLVK